ncbi:hypothetical protein EUGRSUZ_G01404 [Eucalyptus grandis]|uniref:Uncharacterized protein n=3 Tax=Eucalyptus grandis TaxID=71139 RepID=A0A059BCI1_EUCGR|nr:hypothetical protein EUGRSUZ_G01404 [Eucalyptus grandis]KAK3420564.1 hypothetical protein EUGRSUZ_G01404 [Eucalyptus grandis]
MGQYMFHWCIHEFWDSTGQIYCVMDGTIRWAKYTWICYLLKQKHQILSLHDYSHVPIVCLRQSSDLNLKKREK